MKIILTLLRGEYQICALEAGRLYCKDCLPMYACMLSHFSCVQLFVTLWRVACQAPLSM